MFPVEVWLVHFETGEYSDAQEHVDAVFSSEEKANDYAAAKTARLEKLGLNADGNNSNSIDHELRYSQAVRDEFGGSIDYTGAWYSVSGPYPVDVIPVSETNISTLPK